MAASPGPVADPDADLLRQVADGDARAWSRLVDRHLPRLHAFAWRLLGSASDAEDVAQDVFERALRHAPRWQPGAATFSTWLHGVALNLCRDRLRRRRPESPPDDSLASDADTPEQSAAQRQLQRRVRAALDALPERQREAIVLSHYQELPQAEAAALLGIGEHAYESLLARARRGLRASLADTLHQPSGCLPA